MTIASRWLDLVVGLDLHLEVVPGAPSPVPFPHPFVGMVWDPAALVLDELLATGLALTGAPPPPGPVLVGGLRATTTGDEAKMPLGHVLIPPGLSWAPVPKLPLPGGGGGSSKPALPELPAPPAGDAVLLLGSQTVQWQGGRAVRAGDPALSCSDPVRLPTSVVLPSGSANVLVGGPPAVDFGALAGMVGVGAVRSRWASALAHAGVERFVPKRLTRARDFLHDAACFFTGHPVNVVNGSVVTTWTDLELPGPIRLTLSRRYRSSFCDRDSMLGHGWSCSLDQRVWLEEGRVVWLTEDGRELEFDTWHLPDRAMRRGDVIFDPVSRTTLRALGQFRWELRAADGLVREFGPVAGEPPQNRDRGTARLLAIRNRAGDAIELRYDEAARIAQVRDSGGRTIALEHDRDGRLATLWVPAPDGQGMRQHAAYRYCPAGDLVEVCDATGKAVRFSYDQHTLVEEVDRNGLRFHFEYDGFGPFARCVRTWGEGGLYDHAITYDVPGRRTIVEDSLGHATVYEHGAYGVVAKIIDARGGVTQYEHDDLLRRTAVTDPLGHTTRTTYDARGNPVMIVAADGAITKIGYDAHDAPVWLQTPRGGQWRWTYDDAGRPLSESDPRGACTRFHHEARHGFAVEDPAGARTLVQHDAAGNLVALTHPDGTTERWQHDALGRVVAELDAKANVRRIAYDAVGRPIRVDEPDGNVRVLERDGEGNVVLARDRLREIRLTYQGLGKPTSRTIGGTTVRFEYDTEERLVAFVDEKGHAYRFERDPVGDVLAEVCFAEARRIYQRDVGGRVTKVLRPGIGVHTTYEHDAAGRVTTIAHSDGLTETLAYDEDGNLAEASNADATVRFERDLLGRVLEEHQGEQWVASHLDHRGLRIGMASSLGVEQTITRNGSGDVVGLVAKHGAQKWQAAIVRDALGLEVDRQLPGGMRSYWWRDAVGRPTQHFVGKEGQLVRGRRYAWEVDDRITAIVEEGAGELRFTHDARGYLVATTQPSGHVDVRAADEVGNLFRTTARDDRDFGPTGELRKERTPQGVRTYRYDAEGNLVRKEEPDGSAWTYAWDGAGRLREVVTAAGETVTFAYDPLGRRVKKTARGETTAWIWDGDVLLHELRTEANAGDGADAAASASAPAGAAADAEAGAPGSAAREVITWIFDPDRFAPAARLGAEGALSVVTDHLGTPLCLLDEHGAARWQGSLDAWGQASVTGDATLCPWRFPGQYEDAETGLYYNRFRYYDPAAGGYVAMDPLGLAGGSALRAYVEDPLTWSDARGLSKRADYGGSPEPVITLRDPFEIHFSHPVRRSSKLSNPAHGTVADLATALRADPSLAARIPDGGKLYSANNRRLLAFREAQAKIPTTPATRVEATKILRRTRKPGQLG
jgi:RHS repeat-associated protein